MGSHEDGCLGEDAHVEFAAISGARHSAAVRTSRADRTTWIAASTGTDDLPLRVLPNPRAVWSDHDHYRGRAISDGAVQPVELRRTVAIHSDRGGLFESRGSDGFARRPSGTVRIALGTGEKKRVRSSAGPCS